MTDEAEARIAELEAQLAGRDREIGELRLQLDVLATTDIVTGLPNVTGIMAVLDGAAARHARVGEAFGVLAVTVPGLERVAAQYGRDALREAQRHAGAMISAGVRRLDTVGRLDNTTFLIVAPMVDREGGETLIARIDTMLRSVPMSFGDEAIELGPAIALVCHLQGSTAGVGEIMDTLFEAIDQAAQGRPAIRTVPAVG